MKHALLQFLQNSTVDECESLKSAVDQWASDLLVSTTGGLDGNNVEDVTGLENIRKGSRINRESEVANCANDMFHSIFSCCGEQCQHEANLLLRTYTNKAEYKDGVAFEILFSPDGNSTYHEVQILSLKSQ